MKQKNVVITGASAGIGAAVAYRFAKEGHRLVLLARRLDKLEALQKELGKSQVAIFALDVTDRDAVERTFAKMDPIDVLVNNAGSAFGLDPAQEANLDDWEKCVDLNIKGLLSCTHSVLPAMVKRNRGDLINLGSIAGLYPYPGGNVYCATKSFVRQFSLCLRADLLGTQVRVSCIEPGLVGGTEFSNVRFRGDEARAKEVYAHTQPLQPEDIAEVIYFCTSLPPHVNINTLELMPVMQAFAPLAIQRTEL